MLLTIALLLVLLGVTTAQQCPLTLANPTEEAVLRDFYRDTEGFTWLVNVAWPAVGQMATDDPCCWIGVTCKLILGAGVHVTEINLAFNNLKGKLPESIGNLKYLSRLLLHENRIAGTVPAGISTLTSLELLFLQKNRFTGPIPALGQLRKLQAVYFEENMFNGPFPDLTGLNVLETVDVSNNQLGGALPQQITNGKLADLRANKNMFTGELPPSWFRLGTLKGVQLSDNMLTGAVPPISTSIKVLYLSNNKLGCYAPQTMGTDLKIDGNKFLCQPGVLRVAGCVNPTITALISPPQGVVQLMTGVPSAVQASLTVNDVDPLRGCPDMYCYLGSQRQGQAQLSETGMISCMLNPTAVGSYALSLRTQDGTTITQQANGVPIIVRVKAGCGGPNGMCNSPNGVCTPDGCICNQGAGWTGAACDEKICPRNCFETSEMGSGTCTQQCQGGGPCNAQGQCLDQGKCNKQTGMCTCNLGYGGADCSLKEIPCPKDCSGRGACQKQTGTCNCYPQIVMVGGRNFTERYTGAACDQVLCPEINGKQCSGHGSCPNPAQGCVCQQYFTGLDCSIGSIPCPGCGGGNSRCDGNTGNCECARGFKGPPQCIQKTCPSGGTPAIECSGHGTCDPNTGECTCQQGWDLIGSCAAMRMECPMHPNGLPCGGPTNGNCRQATGVCKCVDNEKRAFTGPACETPICPTIWENCNIGGETPPRGMCVNAMCVCNPGFAGAQCVDRECMKGSDGSQCNVMSGQGECDVGSGICDCVPGIDGERDPKTGCSTKLCPNSNNAYDCGSTSEEKRGTCNGGKCTCESGYAGDGCEEAVTDPGPIIGGVIGAVCFVLSCAVCVFFYLRQRAIAQLTQA